MSNDNHKPGSSTDVSAAEMSPVRRDIGPLRIIAIGFNIPNSWVAIAASLSTALAAGGTVSLIYGTFVSCAFYACAAVTLAELASVYPTAGGQYHFTSILAPERYNRQFSYVCGMISTLSWTINAASVALIGSQLLVSFPQFFNGYEPERWHLFLIYQGLNLFSLFYNLFLLKRTNWIHDCAFVLTLSTFFVTCITCLCRSEKQSSEWVWTNFETTTGWNDGVAFMTSLVTPCYMYGGLDAALHLAEETLNASQAVPRALMATIGIGFLTAFTFAISMAYCISDLEGLLTSTMPIFQLWRTATRSDAAGLGEIPSNALILNTVLVFFCGCLFLASTAAFNALVGSFLLLQMISFALPATLLIYQKRSSTFLPQSRGFRVPSPVGWICNFGTIVAAVIELVFFVFPGSLPVTAISMKKTMPVSFY
ncbi:HNM1-choline permease [Fusarium mundagurra]|uniref:HNM1-choline permease n=1 Tax=Fusarium mundagurra TaxID=1567541 RepID=A0A8H5Z7F8_9HYPO|nr:HNM1-choline permease [Fusarium mundagurra]